jgi:hypothetical protein
MPLGVPGRSSIHAFFETVKTSVRRVKTKKPQAILPEGNEKSILFDLITDQTKCNQKN